MLHLAPPVACCSIPFQKDWPSRRLWLLSVGGPGAVLPLSPVVNQWSVEFYDGSPTSMVAAGNTATDGLFTLPPTQANEFPDDTAQPSAPILLVGKHAPPTRPGGHPLIRMSCSSCRRATGACGLFAIVARYGQSVQNVEPS